LGSKRAQKKKRLMVKKFPLPKRKGLRRGPKTSKRKKKDGGGGGTREKKTNNSQFKWRKKGRRRLDQTSHCESGKQWEKSREKHSKRKKRDKRDVQSRKNGRDPGGKKKAHGKMLSGHSVRGQKKTGKKIIKHVKKNGEERTIRRGRRK